jgi:phosphatidylserine decarboxylase
MKSYTVTPTGISLSKGEEIGMFEMGSTVAMIFECPKDYHIQLNDGDPVKLGDKLLEKI